jgi:hypothetical protein
MPVRLVVKGKCKNLGVDGPQLKLRIGGTRRGQVVFGQRHNAHAGLLHHVLHSGPYLSGFRYLINLIKIISSATPIRIGQSTRSISKNIGATRIMRFPAYVVHCSCPFSP